MRGLGVFKWLGSASGTGPGWRHTVVALISITTIACGGIVRWSCGPSGEVMSMVGESAVHYMTMSEVR
jgi:hypothetical protein